MLNPSWRAVGNLLKNGYIFLLGMKCVCQCKRGRFRCVWTKGHGVECYPGIYHHVLLFDEFIVDSQRGYRLVHRSNKSVIGLKWHHDQRAPNITK